MLCSWCNGVNSWTKDALLRQYIQENLLLRQCRLIAESEIEQERSLHAQIQSVLQNELNKLKTEKCRDERQQEVAEKVKQSLNIVHQQHDAETTALRTVINELQADATRVQKQERVADSKESVTYRSTSSQTETPQSDSRYQRRLQEYDKEVNGLRKKVDILNKIVKDKDDDLAMLESVTINLKEKLAGLLVKNTELKKLNLLANNRVHDLEVAQQRDSSSGSESESETDSE